MNKTGLRNFVADEMGISKKDALAAVNAVVTGISQGLADDGKVALVGFGTFTLTERAARKGRNPKTGEAIDIPSKFVPKFKASSNLKDIAGDYVPSDEEVVAEEEAGEDEEE